MYELYQLYLTSRSIDDDTAEDAIELAAAEIHLPQQQQLKLVMGRKPSSNHYSWLLKQNGS